MSEAITMNDFLSTLNTPQREAVEYCDGPSLVIAGAGSGKTRVLTYKIAHLIEMGYEPWSILALTFTNKAANEMKERIARIVSEEQARRLWMGTFHSVLLRILRAEHEHIGFSGNFTIYDAADSKSLVKAIIKEMQLDDKEYKPGTVLGTISNCKNQLVTAEQYAANPANLQYDARRRMPALAQIFQAYANRCRQADAMDFDDILLYTYLLFSQHPEVRQRYEARFQYVLVDEYQDTNYAQHEIVWQLTEHRQRVCVVGDDAQSIYSFRGANIDNILTFQNRYRDARLFKLERNYRSTQNIVKAANSLIRCNRNQIPKEVFSENDEGERLHVCCTHSDIEEGKVVVNNIRRVMRQEPCMYSDFAILYRTNAQSRVFEDTLRKEGMPYRIYGGLSFYQRKEVKDVIAYFRLTVNPNDEEAFRRIINYPARGIGATTVTKIGVQASAHGTSLWNVICSPAEYGLDVNKGTLAKIQAFREMMESFIAMNESATASQIGTHIIKTSGIMQDVYQDRTPENLARQENIEELINGLQDFHDTRMEEGNENVGLTDYLSEISLLSDLDSDKNDDGPKVTLMTVHSAKGLEFNNVFVVGMEEGLFPSDMASGSPREMEEERRLFYVAITRAKTRCWLTHAQCRYRYGSMEFGNPSRFLSDIDSRYLDRDSTMNMARKSAGDDIELPWKAALPPTPPQKQSCKQEQNGACSSYAERSRLKAIANGRGVYTSFSEKNNNSTKYSGDREHTPLPSQGGAGGGASVAVGKHVLHDRFGRGEVLKLEGAMDSLKATIAFEHVGTKQLLLKFAKLTVLD